MQRKLRLLCMAFLVGCLTLGSTAAASETLEQKYAGSGPASANAGIISEGDGTTTQKKADQEEPRISEQEALKVLYRTFPDLPRIGDPEVRIEYESSFGRTTWHINMYERRYAPGPPRGYHATLDANTGEILNMNWRNPPLPEGKQSIIHKEQALRIAEQTAKKLQPELFKNLVLEKDSPRYYPSPGSLNIIHHFNWIRMANGVKIDEDGIRVSVDALTGQVTNYSFRWKPDLKLPEIPKIQPADELTGKLIKDPGMALVYWVPHRNYGGGVPGAKLIYQVNSRYPLMLDAVTGKALDYQGRPTETKDLRQYEAVSGITGDYNPPASPQERISQSQARETAEKFFRALGIEGKVESGGGGTSGGPMGEREYRSYRIEQNDKNRYSNYQVGIDVLSGQVVNYHGENPEYPFAPAERKPLSREEALKKAGEFIKQVAPELASHLGVEKGVPEWYGEKRPRNYSFRFYRVINGIPFPQDGIHIAIGENGKVINYFCEWHRISLPSSKAIINPEDAAKKWLGSTPLKLTYFFPREGREQSKEGVLVYRWDYSGYHGIDALTGELVNYEGLPVKQPAQDGYHFTNSWAGQHLDILAGSGLLPPPDNFSPTGPVKRRDVARVLVAATSHYYSNDGRLKDLFRDVGPSDPDYGAIQSAASMGIIEKGGSFNPDQQVNRLTLAQWLINALGYREAAEMNNNISASFKDIDSLSARERNYIGLAQGLGLMQGDQTNMFRPGDLITWEELAAAALKAAPQLRNRVRW